MAVQVTLSDDTEAEVRRIMAAHDLSLDEAVLGALALLLAADAGQLYAPHPDDPQPDAHGQPTRFARIGVLALLGWGQ
jgi:hypothetical protein